MAIYKLHDDNDRFAGSSDGATFQKCGTSFGIRSRKVPLQKRSVKQTKQRNIFESVATEWYKRTTFQKNTYATQAPNHERTDSLGNVYELKPNVLQNSQNVIRVNGLLTKAATMPAPITPTPIVGYSTTWDLSAQSLILASTPNIVPAQNMAVQYVSAPQLTQNLNFPIENMQVLVRIAAGFGHNVNRWNELVALFGPMNNRVGMFINVIEIWYQMSTGQELSRFQSFAFLQP
jgi:hypothetical protein